MKQNLIWKSLGSVACLVTASFLAGCSGGSDVSTAAVAGTITLNGEPAEGVSVSFAPDSGMRPSVGVTDAQGRYRAQFTRGQSGVALGPSVVQLSIFRGDSERNWLPKKFNKDAAKNPDLKLDVTPGGATFDYDIKYDGEIPPPS
ncbi:MAG: hypothetical protein NXI22_13065 [bacterium]|nr:hypothetical protein [bacterium]